MAAITIDRLIQRLNELSEMSPDGLQTLVSIQGEFDSKGGVFCYQHAIPELMTVIDAHISDSRELFYPATNDDVFGNSAELISMVVLRGSE